MNNERRKRIKLAIENLQNLQAQVESIKDEVEDLQGEESDAFDNLPESLQSSDKGLSMEACIDNLSSAANDLDSFDFDAVVTALESAME